jgi:hypothetical protein
MRYGVSVIIILLFISSIGKAQVAAVQVTPIHDGTQTVSSPALQVDAHGGVYCAWIQPKKALDVIGPVLFSYSADGVHFFPQPVNVVGESNAFSTFSRAPSFILDTGGFVHIVWMGQKNEQTQTDIWYSWSYDNGKHWAIPLSVVDADDSSTYYQDYPSIACDSSGNLYIAFIDYRETQRKHTPYADVYFTRSTDAGKTWSKNKKVDSLPSGIGGASEASVPKIEVSPEGHIYIAYRGNIKTDRRIWLARSFDKGLTFEPSLMIQDSDWYVAICPGTPPSLALDKNERAHIVWRVARVDHLDPNVGESHLYYATVDAGSNTVPKNILLTNPDNDIEEYPDISLFNRSRDYVICYQSTTYSGRFQLYNDLTPTFFDSLPEGKRQQHISVRFGIDGSRNFLWLDSKENLGDDIYYWKDTTHSVLAVKQYSPATASTLLIQSNPAFEQTTVTTTSEHSIASFAATDLLGRSTSIPFTQLSPSSYRLDLHSLTGGSYILSADIALSPAVLSAKLIVIQ